MDSEDAAKTVDRLASEIPYLSDLHTLIELRTQHDISSKSSGSAAKKTKQSEKAAADKEVRQKAMEGLKVR